MTRRHLNQLRLLTEAIGELALLIRRHRLVACAISGGMGGALLGAVVRKMAVV